MKTKLSVLILIAALLSQSLVSCGTTDGDTETTDAVVTTSTSGETTDTTEATDTTAATVDVSVTELADAVKEAMGEDYLPNTALDAEMLESTYGVKPEWVEEFVAETPLIGFNCDTLIIGKATDGNAANVEQALKDYRQFLQDSAVQYPANTQKIATCRVESHGDYVYLVMLAYIPMELEETGDEQAMTQLCEESNQKAIDAIEALLG